MPKGYPVATMAIGAAGAANAGLMAAAILATPTPHWPSGSMPGAPRSPPRSPRSPPMTDPLPSGATIGILGGGQLGRMLSVAASRLGYRTHIFEPGARPRRRCRRRLDAGPYDDEDALRAFAGACDVITYEFENIPADALDLLSKRDVRFTPTARAGGQPGPADEKTVPADLGLTTAPFAPIDGPGRPARGAGRSAPRDPEDPPLRL
jgi:hypothetical protein